MLNALWRRGQWFIVFAGFCLVIGSWSIAAPFNGNVDEHEHIIRAAAVASGQFVAEYKPGLYQGFQTVPEEYVAWRGCWVNHPEKTAACAEPLARGNKRILAATAAGRYSPFYYALVGAPLNIFRGWTGLLLARLISAALSAAFLASAFVVLARWSRYGLMLAGLIVVSSPMFVSLSGSINPNGLEIAAGIALSASAIPLFLSPRRGPVAPLVWLFGTSAVALAMTKATGPAWVAIAVFPLLVPMRMARMRELVRLRLVKLCLVGIAVATAAAAWWTISQGADKILPIRPPVHVSTAQAVFLELDRWVQWQGGYLTQIVGLTGWLDIRMFNPAYPVWWFTAAALIVPVFAFGRWLDRWRLVLMIAGAVGVPMAIQVVQANSMGFVTQARYFMALLAGVPLLASFLLERNVFTAAQCRSFTRLTVLALLPIQLIALMFTMGRWQHGIPTYSTDHWLYSQMNELLSPGVVNPLTGDWHPVVGSLLPVVSMAAGLLIVGYMAWRAPSIAAEVADEAWDRSETDRRGPGVADRSEEMVETAPQVRADTSS